MRSCSLVAAAAFLSVSLAAHADSFDFTFGSSSSAFSGSGLLTTGSPEAPGEYVITGVNGTAETSPHGTNLAIQSILNVGIFPTLSNGGTFPANDNTLFVTNGIGRLSVDGLSFILSNGAQINLFNDGPGVDAFLENGTTTFENVPITITAVAPTPEPSSVALLGTGLLGIAGFVRRRSA